MRGEMHNVAEEDGEVELGWRYSMSALNRLLCVNIQKHVELKEQAVRTYMETSSAVMTWTMNMRLAKESGSGVQDIGCGHKHGGGGGV